MPDKKEFRDLMDDRDLQELARDWLKVFSDAPEFLGGKLMDLLRDLTPQQHDMGIPRGFPGGPPLEPGDPGYGLKGREIIPDKFGNPGPAPNAPNRKSPTPLNPNQKIPNPFDRVTGYPYSEV
jgi:hypothetical protein